MLVLRNLPVAELCFYWLTMSEGKERKIASQHRAFNSEWTNKYLFAISKDKIICLVCREMVAVSKEYNLRRNLETQHPAIATVNSIKMKRALKQRASRKALARNSNFSKHSTTKV